MRPTQQRIDIADSGDPAAARRWAVQLAEEAGASETAVGTVALVVTELASNILKHVGRGEILLRRVQDGSLGGIAGQREKSTEIEVLAIDSGTGMENVERCMRDGYSTAGTPGTGLGAVKRMSSTFDIYSDTKRGTIALARVPIGPLAPTRAKIEWGTICLPLPPETECGDAWQIVSNDEETAAIVVDGLGHGIGAAAASETALRAFLERPLDQPAEVLGHVHRKMSGTRGGAVAVMQKKNEGEIHYAAIGNISASLLLNGQSRGLLTQPGIVGGPIGNKIKQFEYPLEPGTLLIMHSDGLKSRWNLNEYPGLTQCHPGVIAGVLLRDYSRRTDDITVVVVAFQG